MNAEGVGQQGGALLRCRPARHDRGSLCSRMISADRGTKALTMPPAMFPRIGWAGQPGAQGDDEPGEKRHDGRHRDPAPTQRRQRHRPSSPRQPQIPDAGVRIGIGGLDVAEPRSATAEGAVIVSSCRAPSRVAQRSVARRQSTAAQASPDARSRVPHRAHAAASSRQSRGAMPAPHAHAPGRFCRQHGEQHTRTRRVHLRRVSSASGQLGAQIDSRSCAA